MMSKIMTMIKTGINKGIDDTGNFQRGVFKWLGRPSQKVQSFVPFGTFGTPQEGTQGILLSLRANESNIISLNGDPQNRIVKETSEGEYGIGNPLTKSNIYFKEDGSIEIKLADENGIVIDSDGNIILNDGVLDVARKTDSIQINSTTDSDFILWVASVDAFLNAAADLATLGTANAAYKVAVPTPPGPPSTVDGTITDGNSTVKA